MLSTGCIDKHESEVPTFVKITPSPLALKSNAIVLQNIKQVAYVISNCLVAVLKVTKLNSNNILFNQYIKSLSFQHY